MILINACDCLKQLNDFEVNALILFSRYPMHGKCFTQFAISLLSTSAIYYVIRRSESEKNGFREGIYLSDI